jgi:hypothetical protein
MVASLRSSAVCYVLLFVVDLVSMPAAGWVVARIDQGGAPGEVIGISELLSIGVIERVAVPFFVPISEDTVVHVTLHVDVDRDGRFTYEPPASFVDEVAVRDDGQPATARALISLLPPLAPSDVFVEDQATDGSTVQDILATLSAPGFVVVHADDDGALGPVLGVSDLLPPGEVEGLEIDLAPPLPLTGIVYVAVYIDRNRDGEFGPGPDADEIGVRDDGTLAIGEITLTVPARAPAAVDVSDQTLDGATVIIDRVDLPFPGFVEILSDDDGSPGSRLGVSELVAAGGVNEVEVTLATVPGETATLWARLWVDLDQDGALSDGDAVALIEPAGSPAQASFTLTVS